MIQDKWYDPEDPSAAEIWSYVRVTYINERSLRNGFQAWARLLKWAYDES